MKVSMIFIILVACFGFVIGAQIYGVLLVLIPFMILSGILAEYYDGLFSE